jgi:hypothetical protein
MGKLMESMDYHRLCRCSTVRRSGFYLISIVATVAPIRRIVEQSDYEAYKKLLLRQIV